MELSGLTFLEKTKLKLFNKLFPVKRPDILFASEINILHQKDNILSVLIPSIKIPKLSEDYCLFIPNIIESGFSFSQPIVEDCTLWLQELLLKPEIEYISLQFNMPKRAGKSYIQHDIQTELFGKDDKCIHGIEDKNWCAICSANEKGSKQKEVRDLDLFELIRNILMPPIGENFDNPVYLPQSRELYPFQKEGIRFLAQNRRALLGDEMGLGKSIQAIFALKLLFRNGTISNGLIVSPKSVLTDWEKKLWDWAPEIRVLRIAGSKEARDLRWKSRTHLHLISYDTLREDVTNLANDEDGYLVTRDIVILDEIQKIKNLNTGITKAVRELDANYRWGLSGTPLENRIDDLVSIFAYIKPGLLYSSKTYNVSQVKERIKPYFLRRRKKDVLQLPDKIFEEKWLDLTDAQREAYDHAEKGGIRELKEKGEGLTRVHILALITKLKQICNIHPETGDSCKLTFLLDKLEELEDDDKALVFSQYPEKTLLRIEPKLQKYNPHRYHGSLSSSRRDEMVKEFQQDDHCRVLLMSVKAGGLGITLTRANHVFHFDHWWNPAVGDQASSRVDRIGQDKNVFITSLFTKDTIEERIQNIIMRKRELFSAVIDDLSDDNVTTNLTDEELFSLFDLKKPTQHQEETSRGIGPNSWTDISPGEFEKLIANLYDKMGYNVKQTSLSRDGGIDIFAMRHTESSSECLAIQCKHHNNKVGVEVARELYGVIHDKQEITQGVLFITSEFTKDCEEFAKGKRIRLFNGSRVWGLLKKHKLI